MYYFKRFLYTLFSP